MVVLSLSVFGVFSLAGCKTDTAVVEEADEETTEEAAAETEEV